MGFSLLHASTVNFMKEFETQLNRILTWYLSFNNEKNIIFLFFPLEER